MSLQDKYKELLVAAAAGPVSGLQVREQEGVLYIDGQAPNGQVKDLLWNVYDKIDPNFLSGDLVMNVTVADTGFSKAKVTTDHSSLNIRKGPGTDQPVVGKAAHHEIVSVISKTNDLWWLVKTKDGEEGYCYAQYLAPEA